MPTAKNQKPKTRKLKQPTYSHFRLSKRLKNPAKPLVGSFRLLLRSLKLLASRPRLFGGIILIYGILTVLLVKGLSGGANIAELKDTVKEALGGEFNNLTTGLALFGFLASSSGSSASEAGSAYQAILALVVSLALIWSLRQTTAQKNSSVRGAFYNGIYPLVPFVLILCVIGLQLIPFIIGNTLFSLVTDSALAATVLEKILWGLSFLLLALLSLYMISSSIFALYIVTLPNMTPLKALRSARQLVLHRRFTVLRRLIMLFIFLLLLSLIIMLPVILYAPVVAEWLFFMLTMVVLGVAHAYIYSLYRELL